MMRDGIMPEFNRPIRRNRSYGGGMGGPMGPAVPRYTPMEGGNQMPSSGSTGPIRITKLE